jgi:hypothetical protein
MSGDVEVRYTPHVIPSNIDDIGHDHHRGLCIYWKMSKCGFRLPLSRFELKMLREWNLTPAKLTGTAWCTITSFESFFYEFKDMLGI